ncbi:hypothetical protein NPIL_360151 [Nephila pilipes]|uniref:Uncharacterized protein n=1 Tax=Nephila pilipes TaxID=299642 RepID=A0A8X6UF93_NEPPI|nr:hypothetical protein NPIL_360151 [Nephila pilipes]
MNNWLKIGSLKRKGIEASEATDPLTTIIVGNDKISLKTPASPNNPRLVCLSSWKGNSGPKGNLIITAEPYVYANGIQSENNYENDNNKYDQVNISNLGLQASLITDKLRIFCVKTEPVQHKGGFAKIAADRSISITYFFKTLPNGETQLRSRESRMSEEFETYTSGYKIFKAIDKRVPKNDLKWSVDLDIYIDEAAAMVGKIKAMSRMKLSAINAPSSLCVIDR